jgi:hypothetical protein
MWPVFWERTEDDWVDVDAALVGGEVNGGEEVGTSDEAVAEVGCVP